MTRKARQSPEFSENEQNQIINDLLALKKAQIGDFLVSVGLPKSGAKDQIRSRIEEALRDDALSFVQLVQFLDQVIPWGKQHVFLYRGPRSSIANWKKADWLAKLLKKHRFGKCLNANLSLALPTAMAISSIFHDGRRLRITAIKKREWWERDPDYDEAKVTEDGEDLALRAYVHRVTRGLVALEWDLIANTAVLQVSQLPNGFRYEEVAKEFFGLVAKWLDDKLFSIIDLRPAIKKLHELEENGAGETRSHGITYRTLEGRRFEGRSASPTDPLLGEVEIDTAMGAVRSSGVGHLGNFYWLTGATTNTTSNPMDNEAHVIIVGTHNRVNFPTSNGEQSIRHVLSRIRSHSP